MAGKIDLRLNPPKNKSVLTKENMLGYIKGCEAEDKQWFLNTLEQFKVRKTNNIDGSIVNGYDWKSIRGKFVARFFPELNKNNKKDKPKKLNTFEQELVALKETINK